MAILQYHAEPAHIVYVYMHQTLGSMALITGRDLRSRISPEHSSIFDLPCAAQDQKLGTITPASKAAHNGYDKTCCRNNTTTSDLFLSFEGI